jgi:hypothetical protein
LSNVARDRWLDANSPICKLEDKEMDVQNIDLDYVLLGSISELTRGVEVVGPVEEETGSRYLIFAGIGEDD